MHFFTASFMTVLVIAIHMKTSNAIPLPEADANSATTDSELEQWLKAAEASRGSRVQSDEQLQEMAKAIGEDPRFTDPRPRLEDLRALIHEFPHDALEKIAMEEGRSSRGFRGTVPLDDNPEPAANAAPGGGGGELAVDGNAGTGQ
ncbi:predicted protein [Lichtheimia corymbifera JMRC:FSU:9682]|uniref:CUE domain-containing protein n=1 Tax=Lichtheimia corymbifera JMRC:FSU:9682 TaxID=1263082 RepID=A0A068SAH3_9FUNG|nr:predicted protein [Lichtheimia corymbifera JMRC:FSU:9682]